MKEVGLATAEVQDFEPVEDELSILSETLEKMRVAIKVKTSKQKVVNK